MKEKKCFKCGDVKPLEDFYRHPGMSDGHVNKCKECNKRDVRENRAKKIVYYRAYDRKRAMSPKRVSAREEYAKTAIGKESHAMSLKKSRKKNIHKVNARSIVLRAIKSGKLHRLPCEVCGSTDKIHAHHEDYSKPLDVIWLCSAHHAWIHK